MNTLHWRGREGRQYFQPDLPDASNKRLDGFDPSTFRPELEVFAFERGPSPVADYDWPVWVRVE